MWVRQESLKYTVETQTHAIYCNGTDYQNIVLNEVGSQYFLNSYAG